MKRSSRLENILNQRKDLWNESDTDSSDPEIIKPMESSSDENQSSTCCLICSILPNLSIINTCSKHLQILTKPIQRTKVIYMMPPPRKTCHCRTKSKKYRSRSSSSSSSEGDLQHPRKKRSRTVQSSNHSSEGDLFFSPKVRSQENPSKHIQARLSPSLPPSSNMTTNVKKCCNELLLRPFLRRNSNDVEPKLKNNISDVIEISSDLPCSTPLVRNRVVHVKDDDEELNETKDMMNMAQATEEMLTHQYPQPMILLKRIVLDE